MAYGMTGHGTDACSHNHLQSWYVERCRSSLMQSKPVCLYGPSVAGGILTSSLASSPRWRNIHTPTNRHHWMFGFVALSLLLVRQLSPPPTYCTACRFSLQEWVRRRRPTIPCVEPSQPCSRKHSWSSSQRFYHLLLTTTCSASIMLTIFYW